MFRVLLSLLVWGSTGVAAFGQDLAIPARLSLDEAIRLAVARNPQLAAARSAVALAEAQRIEARLRPNPALTFDSENYPLFAPARPDFFDNQQLTVRIDQELELGGRRRLRTAAAASGVAAAEASFLDHQRRLELDVQRVYYGVVLAKADLDVAQRTLDDIDNVLGLNRARNRQGEISGVDVRRVQVERLRFVDDVFNAQLGVKNARSALLALLNAPDLGAEVEVTGTLALPPVSRETTASPATPSQPPASPAARPEQPEQPAQSLDLGALRARALAARPDLIAAQRSIEQADTETRLQRALRTPNVTVGGGYQRNFGVDAVVFGVTVPLPLTNRNQGGVARAMAARQQAQDLAAAAKVTVLLEVQQAANAAALSRARVDYIEREYLGPAREARDIVLASYRLGSADLIDLLDAQRAFRDTLRTYNRALYDQRVSLVQLAAATGAPAAAMGRTR